MTGLTHRELVEMARRDVREVEDLLMDFVAKLLGHETLREARGIMKLFP